MLPNQGVELYIRVNNNCSKEEMYFMNSLGPW